MTRARILKHSKNITSALQAFELICAAESIGEKNLAKRINKLHRDCKLIRAITNNRLPLMRKLIQEGADVNATDQNNFTALMVAVAGGNIEAVEILLNNGANVNATNNMSISMMLCDKECEFIQLNEHKRAEMLELILEYAPDLALTESNGFSALALSIVYNFTELQSLLEEHQDKLMPEEILHCLNTYQQSFTMMRQKILDNALFHAIFSTNLKKQAKLLEIGADINAIYHGVDDEEKSLYSGTSIASYLFNIFEHKGVEDTIKNIRFMIANDINLYPHGEDNLLIKVACRYNFHELIPVLIEKGIDINAQGHEGKTALMRAIIADPISSKGIDMLVDLGADINLADDKGNNAFYYAATESIAACFLLAKRGAEINHQNKEGASGVIQLFAGGCRDDKVLSFLIKVGADLEMTDNTGKNALIWAAYHGRTNILDFMLTVDGYGDINNEKWKAVIDYAMTSKAWFDRKGLAYIENKIIESTIHSNASIEGMAF